MVEPFERPEPVRVYIQERLAERGWDQKTLAAKMHRSEGSVSKKLSRQDLIDCQWLAEFAAVFEVTVTELFHPPGEMHVRLLSPKMAEFFELASGLSDNQLGNLVDTFRALQGLAPRPAENPEPEATRQPKETSTR